MKDLTRDERQCPNGSDLRKGVTLPSQGKPGGLHPGAATVALSTHVAREHPSLWNLLVSISHRESSAR